MLHVGQSHTFFHESLWRGAMLCVVADGKNHSVVLLGSRGGLAAVSLEKITFIALTA